FWPDGRPSRFNRPQALTLSGCFRAGQIVCTSCHAAHGSANAHSLKVPEDQSDRLCTQCHQRIDATEHSHHAASSSGSRCVECHMSNVNWRMLTRRRDHTFAAPVPELTARFGIPNPCTTCHDDETPEWAAKTMDAWYGDGARRRDAVQVADSIYGGGSRDPGSRAALERLALDPTRGPFLRASAAGFLAPLPAAVESLDALARATRDPEPMVRVAAVRS